jgi:hypothetical protein
MCFDDKATVTELENQIRKAVAVLRSLRNLDDLCIYKALVTEGIEHPVAVRLVEFIPLAYGRFLLAKSGAKFSDYFQRRLPNGVSEKRPLTSEPLWRAALAFARAESERGISASDFLAVAARSAEFNVANQMLNKGSKLENLVFTPYLFPWPESGPTV